LNVQANFIQSRALLTRHFASSIILSMPEPLSQRLADISF